MGHINIFKFLTDRITKADVKGNIDTGTSQYACIDLVEAVGEYYIRELAFQSAINMVANAVSKCEFKTFWNGKEEQSELYYLWNLSPNENQNSSVFLHKLITKLFQDNEVLVIERAGKMLVADSFEKTNNAVRGDEFTNVVVEELEINTYFLRKDVLYLQLNNQNIRRLLNGLVSSYSKLIDAASKDYKWQSGRHAIMKVPGISSGRPDWLETYNEILENQVKPYLKNENGVMPIFEGFEFSEQANSNRTQRTTRDIKALIDDVFEFTAKAFGIPPPLLKGDVQGTKDAVDNFLTFCIDPLCDQLEEEINRQVYKLDGFLRGDKMHIDTSTIKHFDLFSNATSVDKLISSGAYSPNDIRIAAGHTPIEEEWAYKHFITKNYIDIESMPEAGGISN